MEIKTFRAKTMQQALQLVRQELGTEATVLHTRELNANILGRMLGRREFEIAASGQVQVPAQIAAAPPLETDYTARYREHLQDERSEGLAELHTHLDDQLSTARAGCRSQSGTCRICSAGKRPGD